MRKAVIDVGSNSVLLLVAEQQPKGWVPVYETSKVTALGEGTRTSGLLGEKGIVATLAALEQAYIDAKSRHASDIIAAATMAVRIASNSEQFLKRAEAQGTPVTILSGDQEAELGFRAVVNDPVFRPYEELSVIDVGGHSTEIVDGTRHEVRFKQSFPIGTLALRENTLADEHPLPGALLKATTQIDDALRSDFLPVKSGVTVTLGATGTNLITIRDQVSRWDPARVHGGHLTGEEIARAVGWLSAMTDSQRASLVGIEPGREKTVHIGALILERALHAIKAEDCFVSVRGWRYGMLDRLN